MRTPGKDNGALVAVTFVVDGRRLVCRRETKETGVRRCRVKSVVLVGTAVVLAACSSSGKSSTSTSIAQGSSTSTAYNSDQPASTSTTAGSAATATLAVVTNAKLGKQIIVAASGKTVYLYMPDGTSTTSKVPAALKAAWPPVTVSGGATAGAALDKAKIAVQSQPDGTKQVAYNGHLLYTFQGDAGPGTASGEGLGGIWFVLSPAGTKA
jgi:predicted lipoprotein with Yx(FWY)xxD motif